MTCDALSTELDAEARVAARRFRDAHRDDDGWIVRGMREKVAEADIARAHINLPMSKPRQKRKRQSSEQKYGSLQLDIDYTRSLW